MANWKELIAECMDENGEEIEDIISNTMTEEEMLVEFDDGCGVTEGITFTVWTNNYVYFPVCYDGSEWVGSVARNPDGNRTNHLGGG